MTATQYARGGALKGRIRSRWTKEELDVRRKIAGMCNNLNQFARKANAGGLEKVSYALIDLLKELGLRLDDNKK